MARREELKYIASGGLNYDADRTVMPENDYAYALNIIKHEGGNYGVITNSKGNSVVTKSLPAGTNKVIGFCEDKEIEAGVYAIYNSNGNHCIGRFKSREDRIEWLMYAESVLGFQDDPNYRVQMDVVGNGADKLLFFNDGYGAPRYFNIARARAYELGTTTTSSTTSSTTTTTTAP